MALPRTLQAVLKGKRPVNPGHAAGEWYMHFRFENADSSEEGGRLTVRVAKIVADDFTVDTSYDFVGSAA